MFAFAKGRPRTFPKGTEMAICHFTRVSQGVMIINTVGSPVASVFSNRVYCCVRAFLTGEVSDSDSNSSSSSSDSDSSSEDEEFHDGYGEDLMGDEEDRARLEQMTEKEREQELFNRIEKREVLKRR